MKNIYRVALAVAACMFAGWPAHAQAFTVEPSGALAQQQPETPAIPPEDQATKEQLAKLFDVMRIREQVQSVRKMVPLMVEEQIKEQAKALTAQVSPKANLTPEKRAELQKLAEKYVDKAVNIYPVDEMLNDMTSIYQRYLTREDIDAMIAFYSSTAGQHLLDAQPKIAREYMPMVMQRVRERTKDLTAEMMKEAAEITATQKSAPAQPAKK